MTHSKKARNGKGALSTRGNAKARKRSAGQGKNIKATKISQEAAGVTDTLLARATGEKILGKPVYLVDTHPVNHDSGFLEKRLCDGPTFTAGTACGYSCQYCYVESQVRLQKPTKDALKLSGRPFNEIVIRRDDVLPHLAEDLTQTKRGKDQLPSAKSLIPPALAKKWGIKSKWLKDRVPTYKGTEWKGKVIYGSPLVDIAATKELALETVEMCDMILRLTDLDIRLLSKSPLLATVVVKELAERFPDTKNGAKARLILGFSTGTLDDGVASAIERPIPLPSARLKALHGLQDAGFRTYGMLCPVLPQRDPAAYKAYAAAAMKAIRAERCEEIWSEVVNFRAGTKEPTQDPDDQHQRNSFKATLQALNDGGFVDQAALFEKVAVDPEAWEEYSRAMFEALLEAAPERKAARLIVGEKVKAAPPKKLWWLHYPRNHASIDNYWENQQANGVLLLGSHAGTWRKSEAKAAEVAQQPAVLVHASADALPRFRSAAEIMADESLKMPDEVIMGVLYKGTRGVLGGPPKARKSMAAVDLGLSVATGTPWLRWPTIKGKVMYVDYEQPEAMSKQRLLLIEAAKIEKGQDLDFSNFINVSFPGQPKPFKELLPVLLERLKAQTFSLLIIDDLYTALGGRSENSPAAIKEFCALIANLSRQTGVAVLVIHHSPKGKINDKPLVDRFAGSGFLTRDAFTLIGLTRYYNPPYAKLEFMLRGFPDQPAVALDWNGAIYDISDKIDLATFEEQVDERKEDRSTTLLDLLGSDGLRTNEWKKQAVARHVASPATFGRDKKKLIAAKQVCKEEKSKRWKKCAQPSGPAPS